jgi:hypothetical protein
MQNYKYFCEPCNFKCISKCNWEQHINTNKHYYNTTDNIKKPNKNMNQSIQYYVCVNCDKEYKSKSGLWLHHIKCMNNNAPTISENDNVMVPKELWLHMIQDNNDFKSLLMESMKVINNNVNSNSNNSNSNNNNINTTNNTVNNHFNLQFFLNEQCKDAIDISEFINSIQVTVHDLEETGRLGYAEGISRIIINKLKQLDVYKRPIHCSDLKRNMLYIRHLNAWEKDKEKPALMRNMIDSVAMKNIGQLQTWKNMYPGCDAYNSNKRGTYLTIVQNAMNGSSEEQQIDNTNKIIKNVAKEVAIDKSN